MSKDKTSHIPTSSSTASRNHVVLPGITLQTRKFIQPNGTEHNIKVLQIKNSVIGQIFQLVFREKVSITNKNWYMSTSSIKKFTSESNLITAAKIEKYFVHTLPETSSSTTEQPIQSPQQQIIANVIKTAHQHFIQMAIDAEGLKQDEFLEKEYGGTRFRIIKTDASRYEVFTQGKELGHGSMKTAYISVPIITTQSTQVEYSTEYSTRTPEEIKEVEQLEFDNYNMLHTNMKSNQDLLLFQKKYTSPSGQSKIVAEKCDGDLSQVKKTLTDIEKLTLATQGAKVLASVHATKHVHRDVKPENFLVKTNPQTQQKEIRLSDLEFIEPFDQEKRIRGTPSFIAPELIIEKNLGKTNATITPAIDVFSYGATLYDLFPLQDDTNQNLISWWRDRSSENDRRFILKRQEKLRASSDPIHNIIADCINFDPKQRPSMKEVAQRLETLASSSPIPPTENII